jgi:DHA1 family inner membrane transport protein
VVDAATDSPNLASTLNQGAFNLGNATGAWLGGVALTAGASYQQLPLLGALVAAIALAFTLTTLVNRRVKPVQIRPAEWTTRPTQARPSRLQTEAASA